MTPQALINHAAFCGFLAILSAVVVWGMCHAGIWDQPDARKAHQRPIPKGGGLGVVAAFVVGMLVLYHSATYARLADPYFRSVILAAIVIACVAFVDDIRDFSFTIKFSAQICAALIAVASGFWVRFYGLPWGGVVDAGWLGMGVTVGWILLATNALNFIDGLNGLASGAVVIACGFLAGIAAFHGGWFVYLAALILASGLVGFLPFNFPRARIFMGDVGSQFCGFILAVLGVAASRFQGIEMSFLLVPMLLSGILFDVIFTLGRRAWAGEPLARAHRSHIYQVAHRAGMNPVCIVVVHWGFVAWGGAACLMFMAASSPVRGLVPVMTLVPQMIWLAYVARRARHIGLRW